MTSQLLLHWRNWQVIFRIVKTKLVVYADTFEASNRIFSQQLIFYLLDQKSMLLLEKSVLGYLFLPCSYNRWEGAQDPWAHFSRAEEVWICRGVGWAVCREGGSAWSLCHCTGRVSSLQASWRSCGAPVSKMFLFPCCFLHWRLKTCIKLYLDSLRQEILTEFFK